MHGFRELHTAIMRSVTPPLNERGFASTDSPGRFIRDAGDGVTHVYHVIITEAAPFAIVETHVATRIETVERIFHRTSRFDPRYQPDTPTMGGSLPAITGNTELRMLVDIEHGPERCRDVLFSKEMFGFCELWYSRFSRLDEIDHELNDNPMRETPNRPMPWLRCSTGTIVARLVARPDFNSLIEAYRQIMREFSEGFYLSRFEALLLDLANTTSDSS